MFKDDPETHCLLILCHKEEYWHQLESTGLLDGVCDSGNSLLCDRADVGEPTEDENLWDLGVFRKTYLQQGEIVSADVIGLGLTRGRGLPLAQ